MLGAALCVHTGRALVVRGLATLGRLMGCVGGLCREGARRLRLGRWEAVGGERWLSWRPRAVDVRGRAD